MNNPAASVSELAIVIPGFSPKPAERRKSGKYLLLGGRNIKDGKLICTESDSYVEEIERGSFRRAVAQPGDVIVSTLFDRRKLLVFTKECPSSVVNSSCAILRAGEKGDYIGSYLRSLSGQQDFLEKASKATGGQFIPRLSTAALAAIQVPILPFTELARLGDARITQSSKAELLALLKELQSKDAEIAQLKAQNAETARFYEDRIVAMTAQIAKDDLKTRINHGETEKLEFKSTLRWNIHRKANDREMENEVLKTIAAFCNTTGGELLIGISRDGSVFGTEADGFADNDKFLLHLGNLLTDRLNPCLVGLVAYDMVQLEGKWICHVKCNASHKEVWMKADRSSSSEFFVRQGPSSRVLDPPVALDYIRTHFAQQVALAAVAEEPKG